MYKRMNLVINIINSCEDKLLTISVERNVITSLWVTLASCSKGTQ